MDELRPDPDRPGGDAVPDCHAEADAVVRLSGLPAHPHGPQRACGARYAGDASRRVAHAPGAHLPGGGAARGASAAAGAEAPGGGAHTAGDAAEDDQRGAHVPDHPRR